MRTPGRDPSSRGIVKDGGLDFRPLSPALQEPTVPHRPRRLLGFGVCLLAFLLATGLVDYHLPRAGAGELPAAELRSWTLGNQSVSLRLSHFVDGSVALTSLRQRGSRREWSAVSRSDEPAGLFGLEGAVEGKPFALSGRSRWRVARARRVAKDGARTLRLRLESVEAPVTVDLRLHVEAGRGPLEFSYSVSSPRARGVLLTRADSVELPLDVRGKQATLQWVQKGRPDDSGLLKEQRALEPGDRQVLLCSAGKERESAESVPWLALQDGADGWYFGWAYSGHGRFEVRRDRDRLFLGGGMEEAHFRHELRDGKALAVPGYLIGLYRGGLDDGLADLHAFLREHWLPRAPDSRFPLVHYNTWTSIGFNVNERNVLAHMESAADLGAELFHLDAGWFGTVGDWYADAKRFPAGLKALSDRARSIGLRFGLWVGWTQVGPRLLREHPEWLVRADVDPATYRFQSHSSLTLCLGHRPFREWVKQELDRVVREYGLDFLEFDGDMLGNCRRGDHTHQAGDGEYAAVRGLYEVQEWLARRHPRLLLENCSDGGHMLDYGILRHTHMASVSDLYLPDDNRRATYGGSYPFPAEYCESYMAFAPGDPREQFRSAMMGAWSISDDTTAWDAERRRACRTEVARYKTLRPFLREGRVRHLLAQADTRAWWDGLAFERPEGGVLFAFRSPGGPAAGTVRIPGLSAGTLYRLEAADEPQVTTQTGSELAQRGVPVMFEGRRRGVIIRWSPADN